MRCVLISVSEEVKNTIYIYIYIYIYMCVCVCVCLYKCIAVVSISYYNPSIFDARFTNLFGVLLLTVAHSSRMAVHFELL